MRLTTFWDDRYSVDAASTHSPLKQARVVRMALDERLPDLHPVAFEANLAWADIARVHAPPSQVAGFPLERRVSRSGRVHLGRARCGLALDARAVFHPVSGAHHAQRRRGDGFCAFNFLAGASRRLLEEGIVRRVLIVDLDLHPGDRTHALIRHDPRVALFDIAGSTRIGKLDTGCIVYKVARGPEDYRARLAWLPGMLDHRKRELVQYEAGVDCHEDDPVGGVSGIDEGFLLGQDRLVIREGAAWRIWMVIDLAGSYEGFSERLRVQTMRVALERVGGGDLSTRA